MHRAQSWAANETSRFNQQSNRPESGQQLTAAFEPVNDYTENVEQIQRFFGQANTDNLLRRLTNSAEGTNFARIDLNDDDDSNQGEHERPGYAKFNQTQTLNADLSANFARVDLSSDTSSSKATGFKPSKKSFIKKNNSMNSTLRPKSNNSTKKPAVKFSNTNSTKPVDRYANITPGQPLNAQPKSSLKKKQTNFI